MKRVIKASSSSAKSTYSRILDAVSKLDDPKEPWTDSMAFIDGLARDEQIGLHIYHYDDDYQAVIDLDDGSRINSPRVGTFEEAKDAFGELAQRYTRQASKQGDLKEE